MKFCCEEHNVSDAVFLLIVQAIKEKKRVIITTSISKEKSHENLFCMLAKKSNVCTKIKSFVSLHEFIFMRVIAIVFCGFSLHN